MYTCALVTVGLSLACWFSQENFNNLKLFTHGVNVRIILKVLGHGHVFEVWILISSGSDNPDSNTCFWSDLIG